MDQVRDGNCFCTAERYLELAAYREQIQLANRKFRWPSVYLFHIQTRIHAASRKDAQARLDVLDTTLYTTILDACALHLHPKQCVCATENQTYDIFITFKIYPFNSQSYELVRNETVICTNITIREKAKHSLIWPGIGYSRNQDSSAVKQLKVIDAKSARGLLTCVLFSRRLVYFCDVLAQAKSA